MSSNRSPMTDKEKADLLVEGLIKAAIKVKNDPANVSALNNMLIVFNGLVTNKTLIADVNNTSLKKLLIANTAELESVQSALNAAQNNEKGNPVIRDKIPAFLKTLAELKIQHSSEVKARSASKAPFKKGDAGNVEQALRVCRAEATPSNINKLVVALIAVSDREQSGYTNLRSDVTIALQESIKANPQNRDLLLKAYESSELLVKKPDFIKYSKEESKRITDELYSDLYSLPANPPPAPKTSKSTLDIQKAFGGSPQGVAARLGARGKEKEELAKKQELAKKVQQELAEKLKEKNYNDRPEKTQKDIMRVKQEAGGDKPTRKFGKS